MRTRGTHMGMVIRHNAVGIKSDRNIVSERKTMTPLPPRCHFHLSSRKRVLHLVEKLRGKDTLFASLLLSRLFMPLHAPIRCHLSCQSHLSLSVRDSCEDVLQQINKISTAAIRGKHSLSCMSCVYIYSQLYIAVYRIYIQIYDRKRDIYRCIYQMKFEQKRQRRLKRVKNTYQRY